jgi:WD40 repeat protein
MHKPLELTLELMRKDSAEDPHSFSFKEQQYLRRLADGTIREATFPWNDELLGVLALLEQGSPDRNRVQRLGNQLRSFLDCLGWERQEEALLAALAEGRDIHITVRAAAAELYVLPWALVTLRNSGQHLGELTGCTLRYEWPGLQAPLPGIVRAPATAPPMLPWALVLPQDSAQYLYTWTNTESAPSSVDSVSAQGRILFAWSEAGGPVPAKKHQESLLHACEQGDYAFNEQQDVLAHVSTSSLEAALQRKAREPINILHVLCHGAQNSSGVYGLVWDGQPQGDFVDGARLRSILAPHAESLRLVVLCSCYSSNPGSFRNYVGSVAQELHRAGIRAVVASQMPLSTGGSILLTQMLYGELLGRPCSLQQALSFARQRLLARRRLDWASLQFYARPEVETDYRPVALRPYRGPLAFEAKHRRFFFGRTDMEQKLRQRVQEVLQGRRPRFQVVAGASGSGKSSLVMAGLVPLLPHSEWAVLEMQPSASSSSQQRVQTRGGQQWGTLAHLWRRIHAEHAPGDDPPHAGTTEEEILAEFQRLRANRPGCKILLVVDQLEEVFTQVSSPEEREAFLRTLWNLTQRPELELLVIATLRVDTFALCGEIRLTQDKGLDTIVYDEAHRLFVEPINSKNLAEVILAPAEKVGLVLEPGLLEELIRDMEHESWALPLLEHALDLLWLMREGGQLTKRAYTQIGGVAGSIAHTGEHFLRGLTQAHYRLARLILVKLVDFREGASRYTRRRIWVSDVRPRDASEHPLFDKVVAELVSYRLVTMGIDRHVASEKEESWLELSHESLIEQWQTLRQWSQEDAEQQIQIRKVEGWAEEWREHREDADGGASFLLRSGQLQYALTIKMMTQGALSLLAEEFLALSQTAEALRHEAESRQREEELAKNRMLVETRAQSAKRLKWGLVAALTLLVAVLGATVFANIKRLEADRQRVLALDAARMLNAKEELRRDPTTALLILREIARPHESRDWVQLAIDSLDGAIRTMELGGREDRIKKVFFTPNSSQVVTISPQGAVRIWPTHGHGQPKSPTDLASGVLAAAVDTDNSRIIFVSEDGMTRILHLGKEDHLTGFKGPSAGINIAEVATRGSRIIGVSKDGAAYVWNADESTPPVLLNGHVDQAKFATFSHDASHVAIVSEDHVARVWRSDGVGQPITLAGHTGPIHTLAFSNDDSRILTSSEDGTARIWRSDGTGQPVVLAGHEHSVYAAAFSNDDAYVVTVDGVARVWRSDGQLPPKVVGLSKGPQWQSEMVIADAHFSPDGRSLVTISPRYGILFWSLDGQTLLDSIQSFSLSDKAFWSPDLSFMAIVDGLEGSAEIWRIQRQGVLAHHKGPARALAFSNDGSRIVTGASNGIALVHHADGQGGYLVLQGHTGAIRAATFSADGSKIATASEDGTAVVWPLDRKSQPLVLKGHTGPVHCAAFNPDGSLVVTASEDGTARVWRTDGGEPSRVLSGHSAPVRACAFSPGGSRIVTASEDNTVRVWRTDGQGQPIVIQEDFPSWDSSFSNGFGTLNTSDKDFPLHPVDFSPDGRRIVTVSRGGSVRIWQTGIQAQPTVLEGPREHSQTISVAFSADGSRIISATLDGAVYIWRIDDKGPPSVLRGHEGHVLSARLSPDGLHVVSSGVDGSVKLLSLEREGKPIILGKYSRPASSALFSPDGSHVAAVSDEGTARVWTVEPTQLLLLLRQATGLCLDSKSRQYYLMEPPEEAESNYRNCEREQGRTPEEAAPEP